MILQYLNSKFYKSTTQIISYRQIEDIEGVRPQNGMYFKPKNNNYLIVLMLVCDDVPYQGEISED